MPDAPAPSLRLFLALWPPAEVHERLLAHAQAWQWPATARRTRPERLHVTLHFLGDVPGARLADLRAGLAGVGWDGEDLVLDQPRVWPGGIAVLEAGEVPASLGGLHGRLGERLAALGLPPETRRYRPHVTFARKAMGARPPDSPAPVRWAAGPGYALVQSLPGGRGYETLQAFG